MLGSIISKDTEKKVSQAVHIASIAKAVESLAIAANNVVSQDEELAKSLRGQVKAMASEIEMLRTLS